MAALNNSRVAVTRTLRRAQWPKTNIRYASSATAIDYNGPEPYIPETTPPTSPSRTEQRQHIRDAKPFSTFLTDTHNREHDYLRISLTERCNLRCLYCMPEEGIQLSPNKDILTTPEIHYLSSLFVNQGVNKIRLTGGEPTVRKDILPLMQQLGGLRSKGLKELALTTNGISLHRKLDKMVEAGLTGVNISLDTLDPFQFQLLTRRQGFEAVMKSINRVQEMNKLGAGVKLKINAVVMRGLNDHQILPFVEKTREEDVEVRFIEYMPFGGNKWSKKKMLTYEEMLDVIREKYPTIARLKDAKNDTSKTWQVPGFVGRVGFITSMTHNFCGTCNRLRITSDGNLKVCLHGNSEVSLRDLLRKDNGGEPMDEEAFEAVRRIELDRRRVGGIGFVGGEGWMSKEQELLEVIGAAVKRKKAKHAGMGALENMENRPMILIDETQRSASSSTRSTRNSSPTRTQPIPLSRHQASPQRIPLHLLHVSMPSTAQMRLYSSNNNNRSGEDPDKAQPAETEPARNDAHASEPPATYGFQSLSSLFQTPKKSVYTSPPAHATNDRTLAKGTSPPAKSGGFSKQSRIAEAASHSLTSSPPEDLQINGTPPVRRRERQIVRRFWSEKVHGMSGTKPRSVAQEKHFKTLSKRSPSASVTEVPFPQGPTQGRRETQRPWGLSPADVNTIEPPADSSSSQAQESNITAISPADLALGKTELTHVNSSGEAHMVDVGAKADSRRVAIAVATVVFSNETPARLIAENSNKKGDVLGVARVAGIMAAKRTSDLIPLCHPIALSKVDVDIRLEAPGSTTPMLSERDSKFGAVTIRALVECRGPTGVEMEALSAVSAAALTVYDMCKAVDRGVKCRWYLVYKSGGRSGVYVRETWVRYLGEGFFVERGLEIEGEEGREGGGEG